MHSPTHAGIRVYTHLYAYAYANGWSRRCQAIIRKETYRCIRRVARVQGAQVEGVQGALIPTIVVMHWALGSFKTSSGNSEASLGGHVGDLLSVFLSLGKGKGGGI